MSKETLEQRGARLYGTRNSIAEGRSLMAPSGMMIAVPPRLVHAEVAQQITDPPRGIWDTTALRNLLAEGWVRVSGDGAGPSATLYLEIATPLTGAQRREIMDAADSYGEVFIQTTGRREAVDVQLTGKASMARALREAADAGASRRRALRHHRNPVIARRNRR